LIAVMVDATGGIFEYRARFAMMVASASAVADLLAVHVPGGTRRLDRDTVSVPVGLNGVWGASPASAL
jgi:hypothetical protein